MRRYAGLMRRMVAAMLRRRASRSRAERYAPQERRRYRYAIFDIFVISPDGHVASSPFFFA